MRTPRLQESQILIGLSTLLGWQRQGEAIAKQFEFADFLTAIAFVNKIASLAEEIEHHPDIEIRYNKVRLTLTTHDSHELTELDFRLAHLAEIDLETIAIEQK